MTEAQEPMEFPEVLNRATPAGQLSVLLDAEGLRKLYSEWLDHSGKLQAPELIYESVKEIEYEIERRYEKWRLSGEAIR